MMNRREFYFLAFWFAMAIGLVMACFCCTGCSALSPTTKDASTKKARSTSGDIDQSVHNQLALIALNSEKAKEFSAGVKTKIENFKNDTVYKVVEFRKEAATAIDSFEKRLYRVAGYSAAGFFALRAVLKKFGFQITKIPKGELAT